MISLWKHWSNSAASYYSANQDLWHFMGPVRSPSCLAFLFLSGLERCGELQRPAASERPLNIFACPWLPQSYQDGDFSYSCYKQISHSHHRPPYRSSKFFPNGCGGFLHSSNFWNYNLKPSITSFPTLCLLSLETMQGTLGLLWVKGLKWVLTAVKLGKGEGIWQSP